MGNCYNVFDSTHHVNGLTYILYGSSPMCISYTFIASEFVIEYDATCNRRAEGWVILDCSRNAVDIYVCSIYGLIGKHVYILLDT